MFLKPNPNSKWPGLIPDEVRRQRAIESFESRNVQRHELPELDRSNVMRVANERIAEVQARYSDRRLGVARFFLPGYSGDGYAMVVAVYGCGNLCGASWLIILDNTTGNWRVANVSPLGIA
jgi:hypothetical protein